VPRQFLPRALQANVIGTPDDVEGLISSLRQIICAVPNRSDAIAQALLVADALTSTAIHLLQQGNLEPMTGLSTEMTLSLAGRRTGAEARMLMNTATTLLAMPLTKAAFDRGDLSWGQVRAIICAMRPVEVSKRTAIDELIGRLADSSRDADPEELIARVDDEVATVRADLALAREDRAFDRRFLAVQGKLDGGATLYGEADAESAATILEALDAAADRPIANDDPEAPSRAQQNLDALVAICETSLNDGHTDGMRPRPRLLATIDVDAFAQQGLSESARLLWSLVGRPARLTSLATGTLLCDATIVPVLFDGARPAAVGDATTPISAKMRTALAARDGGCRFPGCHAPVSWCDAHHIRARIDDGPTVIDNLLLLCRRCHRRVHRFRWRLRMRSDGTID
jgi:hypothetical protein